MALLVFLAARPGQVVTREDLLTAAWGDEMATDDVLSRAVSELRRALGDDSKTPIYVETIRGTGYRFVPPAVVPLAAASADRPVRPWLVASLSLMLLALAAWGFFASRRASAPPSDPHLVPLTSDQGEAAGPRLAPDGTRIAYAWSDGLQSATRIQVRDLVGGNGVEAATGTTRSIAWSPDGAELAVVATDDAGLFVGIVPGLGGPKRVVSRDVLAPVLGIDWSPDGRMLALSKHDAPFAPFRIHLMSVDSASSRPVTSAGTAAVGDAYPSFSSDGRWLAFARFATETSADVFTVDLASGVETRLTSDEHNITALTFAADSAAIVYASNRDGGSALWRVKITGGNSVRLVSSDRGITGLTVSRATGGMVVSAGDLRQQLWSVATEGGRPEVELTQSTRADGLPSIDPSGRRLAFVSDRSGSREVWSASVEGESPVQLTHQGGFASGPDWSPDGRRLVVQRQGTSETELWLIDPDRRDARRFATTLQSPIAPTWSRDGRSIFAGARTVGDWQLWRIPLDGAPPVRLTQHGGLRGIETADRTGLLFTKTSAPGLWRLDWATGTEGVFVPAVLTGDWTNWTLGAEHVYFIDRDAAGAQRVAAFSIATHATRILADAVHTPMGVGGLAVSLDERRLVIAQLSRREAALYRVIFP
jgi:Tol biopolymer transport system component